MKISKRAFIRCPLISKEVPKDDCSGCEYSIKTASGPYACGFCHLSKRDKKSFRISERHDIIDEYTSGSGEE
jgi:hypothetical protein